MVVDFQVPRARITDIAGFAKVFRLGLWRSTNAAEIKAGRGSWKYEFSHSLFFFT